MFSKNELMNEVKALRATVDNFIGYAKEQFTVVISRIDSQNKRIERLEFLLEAQGKQLEAQGKQLEALKKQLSEVEEVVTKIYAEMLRFTGDKSGMKLSIWAFTRLYDISFHYQDLATMGRLATKESRKLGAEVETVADPRFGLVNVYEPEVLEGLFLSDTEESH